MTAAPSRFAVGGRVQPSGYSLEGDRQYWLSRGRHADKVAAREAYDRKAARRGTVTKLRPMPGAAPSVCVQWDDGTRSECLDYMIDPATDSPAPTGPQDVRLPGDVGAVRDVEVPDAPLADLPRADPRDFNLSGGDVEAGRKQGSLF